MQNLSANMMARNQETILNFKIEREKLLADVHMQEALLISLNHNITETVTKTNNRKRQRSTPPSPLPDNASVCTVCTFLKNPFPHNLSPPIKRIMLE
jgi:hypothetical protein